VAEFLDGHAGVKAVNYPGLSSHLDFELCKRQCSGPGSMLSFELSGGPERVSKFLASLSLIKLAPSLGGFCTLICVPATMTHRGMPERAQREAGIGPGLLRLSIGLEDPQSLIDDVERALTND